MSNLLSAQGNFRVAAPSCTEGLYFEQLLRAPLHVLDWILPHLEQLCSNDIFQCLSLSFNPIYWARCNGTDVGNEGWGGCEQGAGAGHLQWEAVAGSVQEGDLGHAGR